MIFSVMFIFIKFLRLLLFNKLLINAKTSLNGGRDRDSQVKKGGMVGLTGKMGGKVRSENPIVVPSHTILRATKTQNSFSVCHVV